MRRQQAVRFLAFAPAAAVIAAMLAGAPLIAQQPAPKVESLGLLKSSGPIEWRGVEVRAKVQSLVEGDEVVLKSGPGHLRLHDGSQMYLLKGSRIRIEKSGKETVVRLLDGLAGLRLSGRARLAGLPSAPPSNASKLITGGIAWASRATAGFAAGALEMPRAPRQAIITVSGTTVGTGTPEPGKLEDWIRPQPYPHFSNLNGGANPSGINAATQVGQTFGTTRWTVPHVTEPTIFNIEVFNKPGQIQVNPDGTIALFQTAPDGAYRPVVIPGATLPGIFVRIGP